MFHFFPCTQKIGYLFSPALLASLLFFLTSTTMHADEIANQIVSITSRDNGTQTEIHIKGSHPLITTVYELPNPSRIIVDVAEAKLSAGLATKLETNGLVSLKTSEIADAKPSISRLEFLLAQSFPYTTAQEGNEIILSIDTQAAKGFSKQQASIIKQTIQLNDIKVLTKPGKTIVQLLADGEIIDFTHDVLNRNESSPSRLYIDINNISVNESVSKEQMIGSSLAKIRVANRGSGLRIVFDSALNSMFPFKIEQVKNGIEVVIDESPAKDQVGNLINQKKGIESQLPKIDPLEAKLSPQAKEQQMQDAFNFSGYNKERITVEFQKMDLHNVFNFLRQVSGVNIVVDESVQGSLTLVLDDVPWDFALDIILNLKDLEKEERFNTLVIYPKGKGFKWPEQVQNNLSFETDSEVIGQEALIIKQMERQPPEVLEAKKIMSAAREAEKQENFETGIQLYEQALEKWPNNSKLSNKISSIYLVQLRQNAKALYYAEKALGIDKNNASASLNAAIASANMQDKHKALEFFDRSTSGKKPAKEALLSYATFSEEHHEYAGALRILEKHQRLYGNDLNSMVATARIYDKMGKRGQATKKYQAILLSGFRIPPDLAKYIKGRVALKQTM
jgi:type IV pilus assembly protein PilQ